MQLFRSLLRTQVAGVNLQAYCAAYLPSRYAVEVEDSVEVEDAVEDEVASAVRRRESFVLLQDYTRLRDGDASAPLPCEGCGLALRAGMTSAVRGKGPAFVVRCIASRALTAPHPHLAARARPRRFTGMGHARVAHRGGARLPVRPRHSPGGGRSVRRVACAALALLRAPS
jgi:hypothetical protein